MVNGTRAVSSPGSGRPGVDIAMRGSQERVLAARVAEVPGEAVPLAGVARGGNTDPHAAYWIDLLRDRFDDGRDVCSKLDRAPHLHDLGEDAERQLLGEAAADVEPGGVLDGVQRLRRHAAAEERFPQDGEPPPTRHHADVSG